MSAKKYNILLTWSGQETEVTSLIVASADIWGVMMTWGIPQSLLSAGRGSCSKTSKMAPPNQPSPIAFTMVSSLTTSPRPRLINTDFYKAAYKAALCDARSRSTVFTYFLFTAAENVTIEQSSCLRCAWENVAHIVALFQQLLEPVQQPGWRWTRSVKEYAESRMFLPSCLWWSTWGQGEEAVRVIPHTVIPSILHTSATEK